MFKSSKKVLALLLTVAMMLSMALSAFAAGSPTKEKEPVDDPSAKTSWNSTVLTRKIGHAALKDYNVKNVATATAAVTKETVTVNGVKYLLVAINGKAFARAKKVKTITLGGNVRNIKKLAFTGTQNTLKTINVKNATRMVTFQKGAFMGFGKNTKNVTIRINKKNGNFNKIVKQLRANGFKGKIVKATFA